MLSSMFQRWWSFDSCFKIPCKCHFFVALLCPPSLLPSLLSSFSHSLLFLSPFLLPSLSLSLLPSPPLSFLSSVPISRPLCFISPFAFTTLMGGSLCWTPQHALHRPCRRLRALEQPRSLSACRLPEPWSARGAPSPVLWRHLWALAENIGQAQPAQPAGLQPL